MRKEEYQSLVKACGKGGNSAVVNGEWRCDAEYCVTPLATEGSASGVTMAH